MSGPERACQLSVEVHGDQWLVLNDQHADGDLLRDFGARASSSSANVLFVASFDRGTTAACGMRARKTRAAFSLQSGNKGPPGAFPPISSTREIIQ
jgi:hypothetical protein